MLPASHDYSAFSELNFIIWFSWMLIAFCPGIAVSLSCFAASPYGRYTAKTRDETEVPAQAAAVAASGDKFGATPWVLGGITHAIPPVCAFRPMPMPPGQHSILCHAVMPPVVMACTSASAPVYPSTNQMSGEMVMGGAMGVGAEATSANKGPEASILKKKAMASSATIPAKVAWVLQESPAFLVPAVAFFGFGLNQEAAPNVVLCGAMMVHYFQRSFIYPLLIRGGKPFPVSTFIMAMQYCAINGYLQGRYLAICEPYPSAWFEDARFIIGAILFLFGMDVNLHSDHVLRNLRQPGETGYKIPQGGMFRFISAANLWVEVVEWTGFGLASWSWPGLSFTLLTAANLLPRCYQHRMHPPTSPSLPSPPYARARPPTRYDEHPACAQQLALPPT